MDVGSATEFWLAMFTLNSFIYANGVPLGNTAFSPPAAGPTEFGTFDGLTAFAQDMGSSYSGDCTELSSGNSFSIPAVVGNTYCGLIGNTNSRKVWLRGTWTGSTFTNPSVLTDEPSVVALSNAAPTATSVAISGTAQSGSTLTGSYTYSDADSDAQGSSTLRWVKNNVNTGVGGGTNVGASTTYTPVAGDVGSFMYYCVTPVASAGVTTGTEMCSAASAAVAAAPVPAPIPTLSEWAMILMASLMGLFAFTRIRRQS